MSISKNLKKYTIALTIFTFVTTIPLSIKFNKVTIFKLTETIVSAQSSTGTDANTTTKSSGTRDGASKSSGTFPGYVKGFITDETTDNRIVGAAVGLKQSSKTIAAIDSTEDGTYFFQVPPGEYDIEVDKTGFNKGRSKVSIVAFETSNKNMVLATFSSGSVPTPTPESTPTPNTVRTPIQTSTPSPVVNVTPTPDINTTPTPIAPPKLASLEVTPTTAKKSLRLSDATVTALDQEGNPLAGIVINARVDGKRTKVEPTSATTNNNGEAAFSFKFGLLSQDAKIIFTADGFETLIKVE